MEWLAELARLVLGFISVGTVTALTGVYSVKLAKRKQIADEKTQEAAAQQAIEEAQQAAETSDGDKAVRALSEASRIALETVQPFRDALEQQRLQITALTENAKLSARLHTEELRKMGEQHTSELQRVEESQIERDNEHKAQLTKIQETNNKIVRSLQVLLRDLLSIINWYENGQPAPTPEEKDSAISRAEAAIHDLEDEDGDPK